MNIPQNEFNPYYTPYIDNATKGKSIVDSLNNNLKTVIEFYNDLPAEKLDYAYADGKWTPKDILLHLIDTERIFAYRALRISRQDKTELSGFEQDEYVISGKASKRNIKDLLEEYKVVRNATIALFNSFSEDELKSIGKASGSDISVRAIGYILTGHENHHNQVIKQRYL